MNWIQILYASPLYALTAVAIVFLVSALRRGKTSDRAGEARLLGVGAYWAFCSAMEASSTTLPWATFWCQAQLIGICPIPYIVMQYALEYSGSKTNWRARWRVLVSIVPNIALLLILTNQWTGWFIDHRELRNVGQYVYLHKDYAPAFFVFMGWVALMTFLSVGVIIAKMLREKSGLYFWQPIMILVCMVLIASGGVVQTMFLEVYPIAGALFVMVTIAIYVFIIPLRRRDLRPVVWSMVIGGMQDALVVLDAEDRILDMNPAATAILGQDQGTLLGENLKELCASREEIRLAEDEDEASQREVTVDRDGVERIYDVQVSDIRNVKGDLVDSVIVLREITQRRQAEMALEEYRHKLEEMVSSRTAQLERTNAELEEQIVANRLVEDSLRSSEERFAAMFKHAPEPYYLHDLNGVILDGNQAMAELIGHPSDGAMGKTLAQAGLMPEERMRMILPKLAALPTGRVAGPQETTVRTFRGDLIPVDVRSCRVNINGEPLILGALHDLTARKRNEKALQEAHDLLEARVAERTQELDSTVEALNLENAERIRAEERLRASLAEKEVLLKEIHHRVKNNLQIISSLLSLQAAGVESPKVQPLFAESEHRVRSMALIHEKLYRSEDLARINFHDYAEDLAHYLYRAHSSVMGRVELVVEAEDVMLPVDSAVPCGLILNELMINAFKHAFPDGRKGSLRVGVHRNGDGRVHMSVTDDGVGLPDAFSLEETTSLGMQLFASLAEQLGGEAEMTSEAGTRAHWAFEV